MATTTVKVLAKELKRTAADLLEQLKAAGIEKGSEDESITDKDKTVLLEYLQKAHGNAEAGARKKITLIKRESSEIRQADSAGRTRTVQVEVRKKRVLVKRSDEAAAPVQEEPAKPAKAAAPAKPILSEEELEKRAAEATRQAELLARQEAEMKAAEEARQKEVAAPENKEAKVVDEAPDAAAAAAEKKAIADKAAKELAMKQYNDELYNAVKELDKPIRVIKEYELHELSLVDNPANQFANVISIEKVNDPSFIPSRDLPGFYKKLSQKIQFETKIPSDVLEGSDMYYNLFKDEKRKQENNPKSLTLYFPRLSLFSL